MPKVIKVKCNGPAKHVNEFDIPKLVSGTSFFRSIDSYIGTDEIPERIVKDCKECTFKVIITREMIRELLQRDS